LDTTKIFILGGMSGKTLATFLVGIISDKILAISFFLIAMLTVFALYLDIISPRLYNKVRPSPPNLFFGSSRHDLFVCWKQGIHAN